MRYAQRVAAGKIVAGKRMRLACERQLRDLERWGRARRRGSHRFYWSPGHARHAIQFIQRTCRHIEGRESEDLHFRAGERIVLEPWQLFVVSVVFGWRRASDGMRRFRYVYLEVGRKNAKSTLSAAIGLYMLIADGEPAAQCYSAATTYGQAEIVWRIAKLMARRSNVLHRKIGPHRARALTRPDGSIFRPVHAKALSQEGFNPSFACMDELHAHKTPEVWNVFRDGMGARAQPMQWAITTAGSDTAGICYEQRLYGEHILNGTLKDEAYAVFIFAADEDDPWDDPQVWLKANPNLGVSVSRIYLEGEARIARASARALADFKTKHLCIWVGAGVPYFDLDKFDQGAEPELKMEDCKGLPCWIGVDLAARFDVAGFDVLFRAEDGCVFDFHRFYLPKEVSLPGTGHALAAYSTHLANWAATGHLTLTEGDTIDFDEIGAAIRRVAEVYAPVEVIFDPHQHAQLSNQLVTEGWEVTQVHPHAKNYSPATKELKALMMEGRYRHPANPMLRWMIGNVHCAENWREEVYPRKEKRDAVTKIDGAIMTIMSLYRSMAQQESYFMGGVTSV
jgi:phage terminase large subunit-like protein